MGNAITPLILHNETGDYMVYSTIELYMITMYNNLNIINIKKISINYGASIDEVFLAIPSSVKTIYFYHSNINKSKITDLKNLSSSVHTVNFLYVEQFDEKISGNLPNNIHTIEFTRSDFNQNIDDLPTQLHTLALSRDFNKSVDNLPTHLNTLSFGYSFNQSVDSLPYGIKIIEFGVMFNQSINIPRSVHTIKFKNHFITSISSIPSSVNTIIFHEYTFSHSLSLIPSSVHTIHIGYRENNSSFSQMSYEYYRFNQYIKNLPDSIQNLYIHPNIIGGLQISNLPKSLIMICFGSYTDKKNYRVYFSNKIFEARSYHMILNSIISIDQYNDFDIFGTLDNHIISQLIGNIECLKSFL